MPTRSLHARGAGTPGDSFRVARFGRVTRFAQPDAGGPSRRPSYVAATDVVRMGCARRGWRCVQERRERPLHRDADAPPDAGGSPGARRAVVRPWTSGRFQNNARKPLSA